MEELSLRRLAMTLRRAPWTKRSPVPSARSASAHHRDLRGPAGWE